MKVLFCDPLNTQNNFYVFAKFLRQYGVDASIAIDSSFRIPKEHLPEWHDNELEQKSSKWIHRVEFPLVLNPIVYLKRCFNLIKLAKQHDIIICSGYAPIWIHWANKPFIFFSYGSDLDQEAVQGWSGVPRKTINIFQGILHFIIKHQLVWALRKADAVAISPYQISIAEKIGLNNLCFLPHVVDSDLFKPMDIDVKLIEKDKMYHKYECDLILFHPPRQVWTDISIADCKGNDKVFEAFAKFIYDYKGVAKLFVVEKGWDVEASKKLIDKLGINDFVVWLKPMPKSEMYYFYNVADIVFDQFVVGVLTLVAVEAMSCGTAVLSYVNHAPDGMFYPEMPPIINVHRINDICNGIWKLVNDVRYRNGLGTEGVQWVKKYCYPEVSITKYIDLIDKISKKNED